MIENCIDNDGSILDVPRDDFRVQHNPLHTSVAALYVAGQQLEENMEKEFSRLLKLSVQHGVHPEQIGVLLSRKLQDTAKQCPCTEKLLVRI
jgi:hypothetical protein